MATILFLLGCLIFIIGIIWFITGLVVLKKSDELGTMLTGLIIVNAGNIIIQITRLFI